MTNDFAARFLRRSPMVAVLIGSAQAALLAVGWFFLYEQTHERVAASVEDVIVRANVQAAQSLVDSLGDVPDDLTDGSEDWERSQQVIESMEFAGGGFACIVDEDGFIACHPDIRDDPSLREVNLTEHTLAPLDGTAPLRLDADREAAQVSGSVDFGVDGKHYVTAVSNPNGTQLLVHQPVSGLTSASQHVTRGSLALVVAVGVAIAGFTAAMAFGFVRAHSHAVVRWNDGLEARVEAQTREIVAAHEGITYGIAKLAEYRDNETGLHVERMCAYSAILARQLMDSGLPIDEPWIESIRVAASLHDIGKVSIPDAILLKPGKLTKDEFELMKTHAATGQEALEAVRAHVGSNELIEMGIEIAGGHHEKWDGSGYPRGLVGESIPLSARIVAVADVFDALMSKRVYKAAMPFEQVAQIIEEGRGAHFDPQVVDAFFAVKDELLEVRRNLQEVNEPSPVSPHKEHAEQRPSRAV